MLNRFLNSRIPTIIFMLAFTACCLMFCVALADARDSAQITPPIMRNLVAWGAMSLLTMLGFCLCLAKVTRYRRNLPTD
jgi:hypothetical protein